jgi:DNA-binding Lrp family transcriptional regulator
MDSLDARLLAELLTDARVGVLELSRRLKIARATVQARVDKLIAQGVITRFVPSLDAEAMGYGVTAFTTLEIRQGYVSSVIDHLDGVPEILEVHTITGQGDLFCRIVARSNADLQLVLDNVVQAPGVVRAATNIALNTYIPYRMEPLVAYIGRGERGVSARSQDGSIPAD